MLSKLRGNDVTNNKSVKVKWVPIDNMIKDLIGKAQRKTDTRGVNVCVCCVTYS